MNKGAFDEDKVPRATTARVSTAQTTIKPRLNKAQKEFQWKIERENKSMQSRLAKHATKKTDGMKLNSVYGTGGTSSKVSHMQSNDREESKVDKYMSDLSKVRSNSKPSSDDDIEYMKLLGMYNQLKRDTATVTDENLELASKLNRLKVQVRQWEVNQERIQKSVAATSSVLESSRHQSKQMVESSSYLGALERGDKVSKDPELREMLEEYKYLQATRRALNRRVSMAKQALGKYKSTVEASEAQLATFRDQLTGKESKSDIDDETIVLIQELDRAKLELLRLQGLEDTDLYLSVIQDNIEESQSAVLFLQSELAEERDALELMEDERNRYRKQLQYLKSGGGRNTTEDVRARILEIRKEIIRKRVENNLPTMPVLNGLYM